MPVINKHQTLIDFAIEHCGDANKAIEIANLNNISITDEVAAGTNLIIPEVKDSTATSIINHFQKNNIVPASSIDVAVGEEEEEGIDYWAIEEDFIIQ
jgi:hypothetical protein